MQKAIRAGSSGKRKAQRRKRQEQFDLLKPRLGEGQVDAALAHLQMRLAYRPQKSPQALEEAIASLENQRAWIGNYGQWQEQG